MVAPFSGEITGPQQAFIGATRTPKAARRFRFTAAASSAKSWPTRAHARTRARAHGDRRGGGTSDERTCARLWAWWPGSAPSTPDRVAAHGSAAGWLRADARGCSCPRSTWCTWPEGHSPCSCGRTKRARPRPWRVGSARACAHRAPTAPRSHRAPAHRRVPRAPSCRLSRTRACQRFDTRRRASRRCATASRARHPLHATALESRRG